MESEKFDTRVKLVLIAGAAIVLAVVLLFKEIEAAAHSLGILLIKLFGAFLICVAIYQGYDGIRAGLTGTQATSSKEVDDPTSASKRFGGVAWGLICWTMAFFGACLLFDWGWPFRLLFGK
jgi:hypothetical protein